MTGSPVGRAYSSARRITAALVTGRPSSLNATAPARASASSGASCSPNCPTVTAAIGSTSQCPAASARLRTHSTHAAVSTTGSVLGMHAMAVKPPAAAARVPVSMVSLADWPGSRRWTCGSTSPGATTAPRPSKTRACAAGRAGAGTTTPSSTASVMRSPVRQWVTFSNSVSAVIVPPPPR